MADGPDGTTIETGKPDNKPDKTVSTVVDIEIGGKKYSIDKDMAEALQAEQKRLNGRLELTEAELRKLKADKPAAATAPPADEIDEDLVFRDPKQYTQLIKEKTKEEIRQEYRAERAREQAQSDFWKLFYKLNDDLKDDDKWVVEKVIADHYDELNDTGLSEAKIVEKIGDLTRDRILRLAGKKVGDGDGKKKQAVVEGASTPEPPEKPETGKPATDNVKSISETIKARREARVNAKLKRESA